MRRDHWVRHTDALDPATDFVEIYRTVVERYPGRVLAIYIRDVSPAAREDEVHAIARALAAAGTEMILVRSTVDAARDAIARGLIDESRATGVLEGG